MRNSLLVRLHPLEKHLIPVVQEAGCTPIIDATTADVTALPTGVWLRTRPGRPTPGDGPVILAEVGSPVPGRDTWLETTVPRETPAGFTGIVLRGQYAGGLHGDESALTLLNRCDNAQKVILVDNLTPQDAAVAMTAGAVGIMLDDQLLGAPDFALPKALKARIASTSAPHTIVVNGLRVANRATAPVLSPLLDGEDPWNLAKKVRADGDLQDALWIAGEGLALASSLAHKHTSLTGILAAYKVALGEGPKAPVNTAPPTPTQNTQTTAQHETSPPAGGGAVAIIGMGCRFPGANNIDDFWSNLTNGVCSIIEVPKERWDPALFWNSDKSLPDLTYAKIGGFLTDFTFTPKRFRIPPKVAKQIDPLQQMALMCVADALEDANLKVDKRSDGRVFDRARCAVILGNSIGGEVKDTYAVRVQWPEIAQRISRVPTIAALPKSERDALLESMEEEYKSGLPTVDEDSMPGELSNVVAGRVANTFDLCGANFTVDAACASSMAAIQTAVKGLQDGDFDMVVTGGADRSMNVPAFVKFSKIGALSPDHSAPFDQSANGFVMGEGCGVLIMKRLEDARADNDKIYAVVRGVGASSDGRGKGITAPNKRGQILALERAYQLSGVDPKTVDLFECHGTSTTVGDGVEVAALSEFVGTGSRTQEDPARIGSVKSNFGHLKSAAGAASAVKVALALHHATMPPSLGFKKSPKSMQLDAVPLQVQTQTQAWDRPVRRAGISAFGFGGTNFHIVMESYNGQALPTSAHNAPTQDQPFVTAPATVAAKTTQAHTAFALPDDVWALSAPDSASILATLKAAKNDGPRPFSLQDDVRVSAVAFTTEERDEQLDRLIQILEKGRNPSRLKSRAIYYEESRHEGKLAMLFTGQGSQYLDMGLDLAARFPVVAKTFAEADRILEPTLGYSITDLIKRSSKLGDDEEKREALLKQTEHSQPATLTLDIALMRLMAAHGVRPDMVAGHSLGEYAANVGAGIMTFEQALLAVSARGKGMAEIKLDDAGKMAGIAASADVVIPALEEIDGYVVAANQNCPTQTVIAGASIPVEQASEKFKEMGLSVYPLPVSHAFHSEIVAPATAPLKEVLQSLGLQPPRRPITTNVSAEYYPTGADCVPEIIELLAKQISSPVLWTDQINRMYKDGARTFIECGPKRALTGFVVAILKREPHRALYTNFPKRGGVSSFLDAIAGLVAAGVPINGNISDEIPDLFEAPTVVPAPPAVQRPNVATTPAIDANAAVGQFLSSAATAGGVNANDFTESVMPAVADLLATAFKAANNNGQEHKAASVARPTVVCSGAAIGLPGGQSVFSDDNIDIILKGENRISKLAERAEAFLKKSIVKLVKDEHGQGSFSPVEDVEQVIRLAGSKAHFDPTEYGIPERLAGAFDICTQLAIAAGLEALKDAHIPLVRHYKVSAKGKKVPQGFALPTELGDTTGVIFASAFPGYDKLIQHLENDGLDEDSVFDRRFLFQILSMGHSQFAQFIGARGPNTAINSACASTTQAVAMASDWIQLGRCDRVIIVGADDVTNETLLPWIGSGFLAAGAATTHDVVEEAALPFDKRRHGLILGMGAVGLVIESQTAAQERHVTPIAELLGSSMANSAFHGTRLDPEHIAQTLTSLVSDVCEKNNLTASKIAKNAIFMSHETYTPARGGSAGAEIAALRSAFGEHANQITIANTKGFTGHAMGAGIEDAIALKSMQLGIIPPIANFKEPDPSLGDLRLSKGESRQTDFAIRLAAGFGSQLTFLIWRRIGSGSDLISSKPDYYRWLSQFSDGESVTTEVVNHTLRLCEGTPPVDITPTAPPAAEAAPAVETAPKPTTKTTPKKVAGSINALKDLTALIAEKTGYEPDELEPDFELEADLGIDTVKQAEIFSELRDQYGIEADEEFRFSDYPTIESLAGWLQEQTDGSGSPAQPVPVADVSPSAPVEKTVKKAKTTASTTNALKDLTALIAEKTGYEPDELEPDFELEADLGIDTVKQAEIFSELREKYGIEADEEFRFSDYPTIEALAGWLDNAQGSDGTKVDTVVEPVTAPAPTPVSKGSALADLTILIAEKTGYEPDELEPDFELEADLGIDTVKQAEIFSELREKYGIEADEEFRFSDYPTIEALAGWLDNAQHGSASTTTATATPTDEKTVSIEVEKAQVAQESKKKPTSKTGLPDSFRLRRPILVSADMPTNDDLSEHVVEVIGDGPMAAEMRTALTSRGATLSEPGTTVIDLTNSVEDSFEAAKRYAESPPKYWMTVTNLGGLGDGADMNTAHSEGARWGMTKSLNREWESCRAVLCDFDPTMTISEAIEVILAELTVTQGHNEVVRSATARRTVSYATETPPPVSPLPKDSVVLVTGGGRGVSARIAQEIADRGPVSLALVGRGPAADTATFDESAEKARIKEQLTASGERATPVKIEAELNPLRKAAEIRANIDAMTTAGAEVQYFRCDLADADAVTDLVELVTKEMGAINVAIHGAGVEVSRPLTEKSVDDFHFVFDGKAIGGLALLNAIPDEATFISMGSVAGRFGNPGQVDYAAANDALAHACHARPNSLAIDWTAWDDVGMAVRGGMKNLLTNRGVELLPADAGADLAVNLIAAGVTGEVVVSGGLGDFNPKPDHPLLDTLEYDQDTVITTHLFSVKNDPWVVDHAIDGTPVLPGVIGLELMTATAALLAPNEPFTGATDVTFLKPVKAHKGEDVTLTMSATPTKTPGVFSASLSSSRTLRTGRVQTTKHFTATILLGAEHTTTPLPSLLMPDEKISANDIYTRFFHGPKFQVLTETSSVAADGLLTGASIEDDALASPFVSAPLALESAFQAAGLHRMITDAIMGLPERFEQVEVFHKVPDKTPLEILVLKRGELYDVDVTADGVDILRLRGFSLVDFGPLSGDKLFPAESTPRPACVQLGGTSATAASGDIAFSKPSDNPTAWLTPRELENLRARGTKHRINDRIAGRIAAKRALANHGLDPKRFEITNNQAGAPVLCPDIGLHLSISHTAGVGVATVSSTHIGIDSELITARNPAFLKEWFTEQERSLLARDPVQITLAWCAKEATLKALGKGLALHPRQVEITAIGHDSIAVKLNPQAQQVADAYNINSINIRWSRTSETAVVAIAKAA